MPWYKKKIEEHIRAGEYLGVIKNEVLKFIKQHANTSELEVQEFVIQQFRRYSLRNEIAKPIIAFRENSSFVHYYPNKKTNKKLTKNSLILIDIWARLRAQGSPYADITWMAFFGKIIPAQVQTVFNTVIKARNKSVQFIEKSIANQLLPSGKDIDNVARELINKTPYRGRFLHTLGHEIGFYSPHGAGRPISPKNHHPIKKNVPYTIEPGIYLENKFGIRSEIDFYIKNDNKLVITTGIQKSLTKL